jgi:hypothetical protein
MWRIEKNAIPMKNVDVDISSAIVRYAPTNKATVVSIPLNCADFKYLFILLLFCVIREAVKPPYHYFKNFSI